MQKRKHTEIRKSREAGKADREQALIESARRELKDRSAVRESGNLSKGTPPSPAAWDPQPPSPKPATSRPALSGPAEASSAAQAARIAALIAAERAETERQRQKVRRWGIFVPVGVLAMMVLWMLIAYLRRFGG